MLKTWTEEKPKQGRGCIRKELLRARRLCVGLTRCLICNDLVRYRRWQKMHAEFYEYQL